ncbi:MAG TPA: hypothetical protein VHE34_10325 [Puia sp.]|uniref:hypothetical protein n=1 Tax=Puia sp. TaxID=2045100 RepID=UPI002CA930AC|nr:hypothetical protein [Puia sp.]HVU95612.1 hypothetical protein [Puia sp.]
MQKMAGRPLVSLSLALAATLLPGCAYQYYAQAIYVSPFNGNSGECHPLPLLADSQKTAFYAQAAIFWGAGNVNRQDALAGGDASIYWAHQFGRFQCFSGLGLSLGNYNARAWDSNTNWLPPINQPAHAAELNAYCGRHLFGGTGFSGGIDYVIPLGGGCEWRIVGVETNLQREFGGYRRFRAKLPDSLATLDIRDRFFGSAGISTEWVIKGRKEIVGLRISRGWILGAPYRDPKVYDSIRLGRLQYHYANVAAEYTRRRYTFYFQVDGGTKFNTGHFGIVYRLTP